MDLLGRYGDASDDEDQDSKFPIPSSSSSSSSSITINATPDVDTDLHSHQYHVNTTTTKTLTHNPTVEQMWAPIQGPYNPFQRDISVQAQQLGIVKNAVTGYVEPFHMNDTTFQENYNTFGAKGYAYDPSAALDASNPEAHVIGDIEKYRQRNVRAPRDTPRESKAERRKRKLEEDPNDLESFKGPWAQKVEITMQTELTEEQKAIVEADKLRKRKKAPEKKVEGEEAQEIDYRSKEEKKFATSAEESTIFHGTSEQDYQGRTYMDAPSNLKIQTPSKCFIPKKHIHTWSGHSKGVNKILFFPNSGHLLLSASMDKTIKIWDVMGNKHCLRTMSGHAEAVRDISWGSDGRTFVSVSYDRWVKVWDTETGKVISRHSSGKIPFCGKIHPDADKSNDILVGQNNKKIVQWDIRANNISQEYDEHLGPVNSVTFIDGNRRFVSTSDDKKVLVWEYGLPVVIKHISEPDMHSMPVVAIHPSQKWFVGQSQDNQILCFTAINRYKLNRKKRFIGHLTAGYAAGLGFSPDGRFIMSGDAEGRVFFWDWKSQKIFSKIKAHDQVAIGCEWHPLETSKVATCSWDGTIKYWD